MKSGLWIVGAGGHGAVVSEAALAAGWSEVCFFDDRWPGLGENRGLPVAGNLKHLYQRLGSMMARPGGVVVAIGDNARRLELSQALAAAGAPLVTVVHPFSSVSPTASLGAGTVVMAGAVLNAGARVGLAGIINTRASIDHDCSIGEGVHVCPGVTLAGNVTVHDLAWLGIGSCAIPGVTVGRAATVGAGATVINDVASAATVVGCPAKEISRVC